MKRSMKISLAWMFAFCMLAVCLPVNVVTEGAVSPAAGKKVPISLSELEAVGDLASFYELSSFFTDCIAHSIDMLFPDEGSAEDRLEKALQSGKCSSCGRLMMKKDPARTGKMAELMKQITDRDRAIRIMLAFLNEHTAISPHNSIDRLTIVCGESESVMRS